MLSGEVERCIFYESMLPIITIINNSWIINYFEIWDFAEAGLEPDLKACWGKHWTKVLKGFLGSKFKHEFLWKYCFFGKKRNKIYNFQIPIRLTYSTETYKNQPWISYGTITQLMHQRACALCSVIYRWDMGGTHQGRQL